MGCGSGLVGVCLARSGAGSLMLTDGDAQTVANCHFNLSLNGVRSRAVAGAVPGVVAEVQRLTGDAQEVGGWAPGPGAESAGPGVPDGGTGGGEGPEVGGWQGKQGLLRIGLSPGGATDVVSAVAVEGQPRVVPGQGASWCARRNGVTSVPQGGARGG